MKRQLFILSVILHVSCASAFSSRLFPSQPGLSQQFCQENTVGIQRDYVFNPMKSCLNSMMADRNLADYIDTGIGVIDNSNCNCVVGPRVPYSSISPSPQTMKGGPDGYNPQNSILGFGQIHVSGTGWGSYGHFLLSPQSGKLETLLERHQSEHSNDVYNAYYYSTDLNRYGIRAELSPAHHSAMYRLTMPANKPSFVLFDAAQALATDIETYQNGKVQATATEIDAANRTIKMHLRYQGGWIDGPYDVFCVAECNQPFEDWGVWHGDETISRQSKISTVAGDSLHSGAYCQFKDVGEVKVRVAVSFVSCDQALMLLHQELPHWDFDLVCGKAREQWNEKLSAINIHTPDEDLKTIFYSALYRVFTAMSDRTKDNPFCLGGTSPYFDDNYAYWDTFHSLFPLLMLIDEPVVSGNINTSIDIFKRDGNVFDGFIAGRSRHDEQGGNDIDHIIAEACLKNVKGVNWQEAYNIVKHHADNGRLGYRSKESPYRQLGFIPESTMSSSLTLEYAYNDYSAALMARKIGKKDDYHTYLGRSGNWKKLWNPKLESRGYHGFIDARREDGSFSLFNPEQYGGSWSKPFYEANSWTYSYYIPHDFEKLIQLMGGPKQFVERLEYGFRNHLFKSENEPGFLTTFAFSHAGRPDLTSYWAHQLMQRGFNLKGYPDNEDTGAVGSWFVFAALGFFPNAGQDFYYLLAPSVSEATLQLPEGKKLVVRANASPSNIYIKSCRFNGKSIDKPVIHHGQLADGGTLEFELSDTPTNWGK